MATVNSNFTSRFIFHTREHAFSRTEKSRLERAGDYLLNPLQTILKGKQVIILPSSVNVALDRTETFKYSNTNQKITIVIKMILFTLAGLFVKLLALTDKDYKRFCREGIKITASDESFEHKMCSHVFQARKVGLSHHSYDPFNIQNSRLKDFTIYGTKTSGLGFNSVRRGNIEDAIVKRLLATQRNRGEKIHLLSMGTDGLICDLPLLEKLAIAGFTNIHVDQVKPEFRSKLAEENQAERQVAGMNAYFGRFPKLQVEMVMHENLEGAIATKKYDMASAIDHNDLGVYHNVPKDVMKVYNFHLKEKGVLALGNKCGRYAQKVDDGGCGMDVLLSPKYGMTKVFGDKYTSPLSLPTDALAKALPKGSHLKLHLPSFVFSNGTHTLLKAMALAMAKAKQHYREITIAIPKYTLATSINFSRQGITNRIEHYAGTVKMFFPNTMIRICDDCDKKTTCNMVYTSTSEDEYKDKSYLRFAESKDAISVVYDSDSISFSVKKIKK